MVVSFNHFHHITFFHDMTCSPHPLKKEKKNVSWECSLSCSHLVERHTIRTLKDKCFIGQDFRHLAIGRRVKGIKLYTPIFFRSYRKLKIILKKVSQAKLSSCECFHRTNTCFFVHLSPKCCHLSV